MNIPFRYLLMAAGSLVIAVGGGIGYAVHVYRAERDARTVAELRLTEQKRVNDSTLARLAVTTVPKDSLRAVLDANRDLHGRLLAALAIRIPKRDTFIVHDTVKTTVYADGTRTGVFRDSTFAGIVTGEMNAPPYPAPLGVRFTLSRPEFRPEVAFVEVGGQGVAVVSWQGENFRVEAPYVSPQALQPRKTFSVAVAVLWEAPGGFGGRLEGRMKGPWGFEAVGGAQARLQGTEGRAYAGLQKVF